MLNNALLDSDFIAYFIAAGGGFDPLKSVNFTRDEMAARYLMSTCEWLALDHVYCPISAKGNAGKTMSDYDIKIGLKIRNLQIDKICEFYGRYIKKNQGV